jgi:hypothetical protein
METQRKAFRLGQTLITPNARDTLHPDDVLQALRRHASNDWGDCGDDDWQANDLATHEGARIFSVYRDRCMNKFWVITEADRSSTTVLLPEDY